MDLKELQNWVREDWEKSSKKIPDPHLQLLYLFEELGEVAEAIRKTGGDKERVDKEVDLECELGDVLVALSTIANTYGVDLGQAAEKSKKKIIERHGEGH